MENFKRGTYRTAKPGEGIPSDYVSIPMFRTVKDHQKLMLKLAAENAKDVTPKREAKE